jgi:NADH-quinone oxidoreductase subunit M
MLALALILIPIIAGLAALALNKAAKWLALGAAMLNFLLTAIILTSFGNGSATIETFALNQVWIKELGINFSLNIDGISALMILLTNLAGTLIILSSLNKEYSDKPSFWFLVLLMLGGLNGVFLATDAFVFYIFWELALIPIYFIGLIWGDENRKPVTFKFFLYTLGGSLLMLAGIIYLYAASETKSFAFADFYQLNLNIEEQQWIFWALFIAFAIKMPIFPFHTWQPDTYVSMPTAGTMLLSGIMLKMGIYGVLRLVLPIVPGGVALFAPLVFSLAVGGIVYASFIALKQENFKRLIAYLSIAHVGLMAAGLFAHNAIALQGVMIQMLAHGINVIGLFLAADWIKERTGTLELSKLGGLRHQAPIFSGLFLVILMANIALPLTNGFVGEFLLLSGLAKVSIVIAAVAGLSVIMGAFYMLKAYQRIMLGERNTRFSEIRDINFQEGLVFGIIVVLIFWMGLMPNLFLSISEESISALLKAGSSFSDNFEVSL